MIKRKYFIVKKKAQGCIQTLVNDVNDLALHGEF